MSSPAASMRNASRNPACANLLAQSVVRPGTPVRPASALMPTIGPARLPCVFFS
jgi:hypothetical protein